MTDPVSPTERDDLAYLLNKASRSWGTILAERCRAHGFPEVRPAFGSVLLPLFAEDGLRMGELADRARVSKQNLTTLVAATERSGLVIRRPDDADRRSNRVWLTTRAEEFRPAAERVLADMSQLLDRHLSPADMAVFRRALATIKDLSGWNDAPD